MTDEIDNSAASTLLDAIADGQTLATEQASAAEPIPETDIETDAAVRVPPYIPPVREDAEAQLAQIESDIKTLGTRFDDGEINTEQYHENLIKLHDSRTQIQIERALAMQATQAANHAHQHDWESATQRFLSANPDYQDMTRQEPLAAIARMIVAEDANQRKAPDWILGEAKRRLESVFGVHTQQSASGRSEQEIQASARAKVAAAKASAPISISDIPGTPGAAASEFERLDQAGSGFNKIDALMNLPPDKLEAWMNRRI